MQGSFMQKFKAFFTDMFRFLTWRGPRHDAAEMSPAAFVGLGVAMIALGLVAEAAMGGQWSHFQIYGVDSSFGVLAVTFGVIVLFARVDVTPRTTRHLAILVFGVFLMTHTIGALLTLAYRAQKDSGSLSTVVAITGLSLPLLMMVWTAGGARKIFALVSACRRPTWRAIGFACTLWLALVAWPQWPMLPAPDFDPRHANLWTIAKSMRAASAEPQRDAAAEAAAEKAYVALAALEMAQPARLETALAKIAPRTAKKRNVFVVAIAGSDSETVFESETRQGLGVLTRRLGGAEGHALWLVNGEPTEGQPAIANLQNVSQAIRGVAARMDRDNDLLVLAMSSHGSREGFVLQKEGLFGRLLFPATLRVALDDAGVKNRLLIVSACYSGVFLPEFTDSRTAIVTAASASRTSFGCANDRAWTYFGDAFYNHGLKESDSIAGAFDVAQRLIASWESRDGLTPSEPQIFVGEEFKRRFPDLAGVEPRHPETPRVENEKRPAPSTTPRAAPVKVRESAAIRKQASF
jgi:hypothetical protein